MSHSSLERAADVLARARNAETDLAAWRALKDAEAAVIAEAASTLAVTFQWLPHFALPPLMVWAGRTPATGLRRITRYFKQEPLELKLLASVMDPEEEARPIGNPKARVGIALGADGSLHRFDFLLAHDSEPWRLTGEPEWWTRLAEGRGVIAGDEQHWRMVNVETQFRILRRPRPWVPMGNPGPIPTESLLPIVTRALEFVQTRLDEDMERMRAAGLRS